jgi:hypothetical protein
MTTNDRLKDYVAYMDECGRDHRNTVGALATYSRADPEFASLAHTAYLLHLFYEREGRGKGLGTLIWGLVGIAMCLYVVLECSRRLGYL